MSEEWTLEKKFRFEAAHFLPFYDGKCRRLHGHSWRGAVILRGRALKERGPEKGMLADFGRIKLSLDPLVEDFLDHRLLNDFLENPTCEELARWLYDRLVGDIPWLDAVRIEETCTSACTFRAGEEDEQ